MENVDEQQGPRSSADPALVLQVISVTKDVNDNLAGVLRHTDKLIVRQNILVCLCIGLLALMTLQLLVGQDIQKRQQDAKEQLANVEMTRTVLQGELDQLSKIVRSVKSDLEVSITSAPTVTTDSAGRLSLEVNKKTPVQTDTPERVVIPLKANQVRVEK